MHELGALVSSVADPMSDPALLEPLKSMARRLWLGWGHTKMIEDGNREMRDRETRETTNKSMKILKQWDVLRSRQVLATHGESYMDPKVTPSQFFKKLSWELENVSLHHFNFIRQK